MDNNNLNLGSTAIEVYQDFENDIYNGLKAGLSKSKRYKRLILAYPQNSVYPYPLRILHGFRKFCAEYAFEFEIINEVFKKKFFRIPRKRKRCWSG